MATGGLHLEDPLPYPLRMANVRLVICLTRGNGKGEKTSYNPCYVADSLEFVRMAKQGYLQSPRMSKLVWRQYAPGTCACCRTQVCKVQWMGQAGRKPVVHTVQNPTRYWGQEVPFREGPGGCRVLLCGKCYVEYGLRVNLASYPAMTVQQLASCNCQAGLGNNGVGLFTCSAHAKDVEVVTGLYLERGPGWLAVEGQRTGPPTRTPHGALKFGSTCSLWSPDASAMDIAIQGAYPAWGEYPERGNFEQGSEVFLVCPGEDGHLLFPDDLGGASRKGLVLDAANLLMTAWHTPGKVCPWERATPFGPSCRPKGPELDWHTEASSWSSNAVELYSKVFTVKIQSLTGARAKVQLLTGLVLDSSPAHKVRVGVKWATRECLTGDLERPTVKGVVCMQPYVEDLGPLPGEIKRVTIAAPARIRAPALAWFSKLRKRL